MPPKTLQLLRYFQWKWPEPFSAPSATLRETISSLALWASFGQVIDHSGNPILHQAQTESQVGFHNRVFRQARAEAQSAQSSERSKTYTVGPRSPLKLSRNPSSPYFAAFFLAGFEGLAFAVFFAALAPAI